MNKISKFFICLCLLFASCFAMVGCGNNNDPGAKKEWTSVSISNSNVSEYFELGGYLGYSFNNWNGNANSPWADNYYYKGLGITYLENKEYYTNKSSEKNLSLDNFFSFQENSSNNCLKWKVIILKAKENIQIDTLRLRSYFSDNVDSAKAYNSNINLQFTIKEESRNSSRDNPILSDVATYNIKYGAPDQTFKMFKGDDIVPDNHYTSLSLNKEYSNNDETWTNRTIFIKQNQYFCIEFTGIEQIKPTFSSESDFSEIENQANINFVVEDITLSIKVER